MNIGKERETTLIAKIIKSTKTANPVLDTFDVAEGIKRLLSRRGSIGELAAELTLSHETVRQFVKIAELPKSIKNILKRIGKKQVVDFAYRVSLLERQSDRKTLALLIAKEKLDAKTVRDIVTLKKYNPDYSMEEVFAKVKGAKAKKVNRLLVPVDTANLKTLNLKYGRSKYIRVLSGSVNAVARAAGVSRTVKIDFVEPFIIFDLSKDEYSLINSKAREIGCNIPALINKQVNEVIVGGTKGYVANR